MKKLFIVLTIFGFVILTAQKYQTTNISLFVTGTGADTSAWFPMYPYMTLWYAADDTSNGGDSASVKWDFQISPDRANVLYPDQWITVRTDSAQTDSLWAYADITDRTIPVGAYARIIATGLYQNKKLSAVRFEAIPSGFNTTAR